jgi:hypothetical protein
MGNQGFTYSRHTPDFASLFLHSTLGERDYQVRFGTPRQPDIGERHPWRWWFSFAL